MKIGLCDVDSKIPNLPLMKISAYHKQQGDNVEWFESPFNYDKIYASKIFNFSPDNDYLPPKTIRGGTGYDLTTILPNKIEEQYPDYGLYNCAYAMGFLTRGCIRNCPFCLVPQKEGGIRQVANLSDFWKTQNQIMLLDNNLTAHSDRLKLLQQLIDSKAKVDFVQGLDIRLVDLDFAKQLRKVKMWKQIRFAWDWIGQMEKSVIEGIGLLEKARIRPYELMFYVLIGYDSMPEQDLYRVEKLRDLGVDPFVMPFNKSDHYQRRFARWVNRKAIFKSIKWKDYKY